MGLISRSLPNRAVLIAAGLFWLILTISILNRHYGMYPSFASHDQGIFNQVFWNGIHGHWFQSSLSSGESGAVLHDGQLPDVTYRRLGQHFTPIHLLWLPLYALLPFSATLLVLQITLVTAGGLVLYHLARQRLSEPLATWITLSYFCATAVIAPNLANFHDFSQIPLFVFLMLLALEQRRWWSGTVAAALVLLCREDTGIILASLGLYWLLSRRSPWVGAGLCGAGAGYLLLVTNVVMPAFSADIGRNFLSTSYAPYATGDAPSTLSLIWGMVQRPDRVLLDIVTPVSETLRYLLGHWLPLMLVPALSPAAWVSAAGPLLALLLRQDTHVALSMQLRYAVAVVPGLFYGAILWWAVRPQRVFRRWRRFWGVCLGLSLFFTITLNPIRTWSFVMPDSIDPWVYLSLPKQWGHAQEIRALLAQIPPDASVSATDHILPQVSGRRAVLRFPFLEFQSATGAVESVDYVVADLWQLAQYQVAFEGDRVRLQQWVPILQSLLDQERYGLVAVRSGGVLMQQDVASDPQALMAWQQYRDSLAPILQPE